MRRQGLCSCIIDCLNSFQGSINVHSSRHPKQNIIYGEIIIQLYPGQSGPGKAASVQLYSSSEIDLDTRIGKLSQKIYLKNGKVGKGMHNENGAKTKRYILECSVEPDFGSPGAFLIKNEDKHKFFLQSVSLRVFYDQIIHFECNSWIHPINLTKKDRIFFPNTCYLPNQTPDGLVELRKEELIRLRGDGTGERKEWDRIYDYDYYNDLGNPDKGLEYIRPILGGSQSYPYPRRLRTGNHDFRTESRPESFNIDIYAPPDERFSPKKLSELISNVIQAAMRLVIPEAKAMFKEGSSHFESFNEIAQLFTSTRDQGEEESVVKNLKQAVPDDLRKKIKQVIKKNPVKFPLPEIIAGNKFVWMDDDEFGRQMLAGINPTVIQCLQAMNQGRIFILDHHDYLMPFLSRINTEGICAYASRTLLFLRSDATLKPLAIELSLPSSLPHKEINRVFCPAINGTELMGQRPRYGNLQKLTLKTHAVIEPFIIATRRQLSVMHPIHRLLHPHFKDTIQVNALARSMVINAGGILEKMLFSGPISMELSSALYKKWRFHEQSLPEDLIKRGMATYNENRPAGVQLLFEDYPYGADGLDIWTAIENWVTEFCSYFYKDDASVSSDHEIQNWWSEIRNVGHGDKRNETWWYSLTTLRDVKQVLTTLIWNVSAFHAAVNFGQYVYASYPPNRPTSCRKFIPIEGTREFAEFLRDPDKFYLNMLPKRSEMTLSIALVEVLSRYMSDDANLGQELSPKWIDDQRIHQSYKKFAAELQEVENKIRKRNRDPKLKNRQGPAKIEYELLYPGTSNMGSQGGITGRGIPNSISI
ncbi:Linoleate 9S-lipoxygenase 5 [Forsythia ovata]|uniref:Lipoxygenase n=1 Tax=Forsythia ovata TaxID=205694 RepID=A0ABD1RKJ0_9LAMI